MQENVGFNIFRSYYELKESGSKRICEKIVFAKIANISDITLRERSLFLASRRSER